MQLFWFTKDLFSLKFSRFEWKDFRYISRHVPRNCLLRRQGSFRLIFYWLCSFLFFLDFEPEIFTVLIIFFRQVRQNAFWESGGKFWGNTQVLRKHVISIVFRRLPVNFLAISIKNWHDFIYSILCVWRQVLRKKLFSFFSWVNSDFERNCLHFWKKIY